MKNLLLLSAMALVTVSASADGLRNISALEAAHTQKLSVKAPTLRQLPDSKLLNTTPVAPGARLAKGAKAEAPVNVVPETATSALYALDGYFYNSWFGLLYYTGIGQTIYTDGDDVYFSNFFPTVFTGTVAVKGTKNADGTVTVAPQMIYSGVDYYGDGSEIDDLYLTAMNVDEEGNISAADGNLTLYPAAEGGYTMVSDTVNVYFGIKDQTDALWTISANYYFTPFTPASEVVTLPEGAELEDHIYSYKNDSYYTTTSSIAKAGLCQNGSDVYLEGLTPDAGALVKGSIVDGKLVVPTNQYLGMESGYLLTFKALGNYHHEFEWIDEEAYEYRDTTTYDDIDALTFTSDNGTWVLDEGQAVAELYADGSIAMSYYDFTIAPYAGPHAAVPADPEITDFADYRSYYGEYAIAYNIPQCDINGEYLEAENYSLGVYADDEQIVFTADDGYYLSEDIDWMPYGWTDDQGGYDIYFTSLSSALYIYDGLYNELGLQVRYSYDGIDNYSNIVYINVETGETRTEYIDRPDAIQSVKATSQAHRFFNLQGQRLNAAQRGMNVVDGKKLFVK